MIIARSPLRISLGGGGTDLASYYQDHGGFVVSAALDKYVYVTIHRTFQEHMVLRYSQIEQVTSPSLIQHPILREAMRLLDIPDLNLEITTMADIPAGTGLGSSSSFTTALLRAGYHHKLAAIGAHELAETACHIEIDLLKEPIGKQDQFAAAYGGMIVIEIDTSGVVQVRPVKLTREVVYSLHDNLLMFSTGQTRAASEILGEQRTRSDQRDPEMIDNLHFIKDLGKRSLAAIESGQLDVFGTLMNEHWASKKKRSAKMSNPQIDHWYDVAMNNGAMGGKLVGAGGGGFLLFYTEDPWRVRRAMRAEGLRELRVGFDFEGTKIVSG
jgi:D-glycero-alpha-D-manno-heptose-7-phosphate kinase